MTCDCGCEPADLLVRVCTVGADNRKVYFSVRWGQECFGVDVRSAKEFGYKLPTVIDRVQCVGWTWT